MDIGDHGGDMGEGFDGGSFNQELNKRLSGQKLPDDLPKSLDDRMNVSSHYTAETEMYDAWQGEEIWLSFRLLV
jgi:hypothetical protein